MHVVLLKHEGYLVTGLLFGSCPYIALDRECSAPKHAFVGRSKTIARALFYRTTGQNRSALAASYIAPLPKQLSQSRQEKASQLSPLYIMPAETQVHHTLHSA